MKTQYFRAPVSGQTRICTNPWSSPYVNTDGGVKPCCWIHEPLGHVDDGGLPAIMNNAGFQQLRQKLLNGDLRAECHACVHAPLGSVDELRSLVQQASAGQGFGGPEERAAKDAHLHTSRLSTLMVSVTDTCNLRCGYCMVSKPDWNGREASTDMLLKLADRLPALATDDVVLNGNGETTFHQDWMVILQAFAKTGRHLSLASNLSKVFESDELDCLAQIHRIMVSVDCIDRKQLLKIRKGADIRTITYNVMSVLSRWSKDPVGREMIVQTVMSIDVVYEYADLVEYFLRIGIRSFWLCNLIEYDASEGSARHLASVATADGLLEVLEALARAHTRVIGGSGWLTTQAGLLDSLEDRARELGVELSFVRERGGFRDILVCGSRLQDLAHVDGLTAQRTWLSRCGKLGLSLGYVGNLDDVTDDGRVRGWAACPVAPGRRLLIEIVLDGRVVGAGVADQRRDDVCDAGYGDGFCEYDIGTSYSATELRSAKVEARVAHSQACWRECE